MSLIFYSITELAFIGLLLLIIIQCYCFKINRSVAIYSSIWAFITWQLVYELQYGIIKLNEEFFEKTVWLSVLLSIVMYLLCYLIVAFMIAKWIPAGSSHKVGPRQLASAVIIFGIFELLALSFVATELSIERWLILYLSQLLLTVIMYLQSELFQKSAMRQELEAINFLWEKEREQYRLSKENISLINQKCHDLKHQIRAIRSAGKEDIDRYLLEMEDSIRIYEAIVKTGNEVLDTILTEKSLYCKDKGIVVSCVADGGQMNFINTVDLYAILGNAMDNAIEAVEGLSEEQKQIDVLIYRQQNFLVINIINPINKKLVYEEEFPVTTKADKLYHGFGLKSMKYIVKKYDGFLNISEEDGCFSLKVLIPVPLMS